MMCYTNHKNYFLIFILFLGPLFNGLLFASMRFWTAIQSVEMHSIIEAGEKEVNGRSNASVR